MSKLGKVLLIVGPAASGKSTLAQYIAERQGWRYLSEDDYWVKNGWSGLRTPEQESTVQQQVAGDLLPLCSDGTDVVLEFILYKDPPNPLTAYQTLLTGHAVTFHTIALKPSVEEIITHMKHRGRATDLNNLQGRRKDAENQLRCLEAAYVKNEWIIDPTNMSLKELHKKCLDVIGT